MDIINPHVFEEAKRRFPKKRRAIDDLRQLLTAVQPRNSSELKGLLPSLQMFPGRPNCYRLDVGGRKGLRMIAIIRIRAGTVYIHLLGNHAEYESFKF